MVLDCSGFGSKLVELDGDLEPGVQVSDGGVRLDVRRDGGLGTELALCSWMLKRVHHGSSRRLALL
eukprot:34315-Eustigmatos_ZCMA.PRE.1